MQSPTEWLLQGPPWVQYRARVDLMRQRESNPQVRASRQAMLTDPQVKALIDGLGQWPGPVLTSHKSAGHPLHQLVFIADLGLRADDPGMDRIVDRILQHHAPDGPFQVLMNIPVHFGGTGRDQFAWALCDSPLVVYALCRFGLHAHAQVRAAVRHLQSLVRDNGFPCAVSPEMGKFHGPGRKNDPCPFANLTMLKVLSHDPRHRDSEASRHAVESLLALWDERRQRHPYLFYMGTDFSKLKAPLVWYDTLNVLDVLTRFPWALEDRRLKGMANLVQAKADKDGRYTPESIWTAWQGWEFGQKREPSYWLTLLAWRAISRVLD